MIKTWNITIPELTEEETRLAYVYLPDSYETSKNRRYPVLYMFDGHNVFFDSHATYGKSWGMKEYMESTETQIIIAAVECNHGVNHDRLKEYTPYDFYEPGYGNITAKGDIYMHWLINEFKPDIDRTYRTLPDREHTMIAGSSMGGLMSLYAILQYNNIFSRAACLSPSVHFVLFDIRKLMKKSKVQQDSIIYMDCGEKELEHYKFMKKEFGKIFTSLICKDINVTARIIPDGTHCEASWEQQIPIFMKTLQYNMMIPESDIIEEEPDIIEDESVITEKEPELTDGESVIAENKPDVTENEADVIKGV